MKTDVNVINEARRKSADKLNNVSTDATIALRAFFHPSSNSLKLTVVVLAPAAKLQKKRKNKEKKKNKDRLLVFLRSLCPLKRFCSSRKQNCASNDLERNLGRKKKEKLFRNPAASVLVR